MWGTSGALNLRVVCGLVSVQLLVGCNRCVKAVYGCQQPHSEQAVYQALHLGRSFPAWCSAHVAHTCKPCGSHLTECHCHQRSIGVPSEPSWHCSPIRPRERMGRKTGAFVSVVQLLGDSQQVSGHCPARLAGPPESFGNRQPQCT